MADDVETYFEKFFERLKPNFIEFANGFVDDPDAAIDEAADTFAAMVPDMAYRDDRRHPMAISVFGCCAQLAVYLALNKRGVDVHDYGRAMLVQMRRAMQSTPPQPEDAASAQKGWDRFAAAAAKSRDAAPGEFVFEMVSRDGTDFNTGFNIKSCAICHAFSKYDAMTLVPYMCAADDVVSDRGDQGLERTGTIAVGAHQCDFRYKRGREPRHLADRYPDRIRIAQT